MALATNFATGFTADSFQNMITGPGVCIVDYGLPTETLLGVTDGGNEFNPGITYRDISGDFRFPMNKGGRILDEVSPTITTNLKSFKPENMPLLFPGMTSTAAQDVDRTTRTLVEAEAAGTGDDTLTVFALGNDTVRAGSLTVYIDGTVVEDWKYKLFNVGEVGHSGGTGAELKFTVAPATGEAVTADYIVEPTVTAATHYQMKIGNVTEAAYFKNVTLIATVLGSGERFIAQILNAIVSEPPTFSFANKEETSSAVTFTGTTLPSDMEAVALGEKAISEVVPFRIYFPNTSA